MLQILRKTYCSIILVIVVMFAIISIGLLSSCGMLTTSNTGNVSVKTIVVNKHKIQSTIDVSGVLNASQTVNVALKAGGKIESVKASVGQLVNVGDVLATLETKELNVQLEQAQNAVNAANGQIAQARINLDSAVKTYDATKKLLEDQEFQAKLNLESIERSYKHVKEQVEAIQAPQSDLDDIKGKYDIAKRQYDMAKVDTGTSAQNQLVAAKSRVDIAEKQFEIASGATLEQARSAVSAVQVQIDNTVLKSPISGIIVNKNINIGEIASPGVTLFTVADVSTLKLKGTVTQEAVALLQSGQEMNVLVDIYPDKQFKGYVDTVGPVAVSTGEYFPIEISIKNTGELRAGLSAHGNIAITTNENICVPVESLIQSNGQSYVFTVKNNIASKRTVTTGFKNDKEIEILKGIEIGEAVATTSVNVLVDNMPIVVK